MTNYSHGSMNKFGFLFISNTKMCHENVRSDTKIALNSSESRSLKNKRKGEKRSQILPKANLV